MQLTPQEQEMILRLLAIYNSLDDISKVNYLMFGEGMVAATQIPRKGA